MKCDICHKNEATIHVQEIIGGTKNKLNICASCAAEHNIGGDGVEGLNLAEILYNISSQMLEKHAQTSHAFDSDDIPFDDPPEITCSCGWNTARFKDGGRLGCPECYDVFAPMLANALNSMHKGTSHIGKHPKNSGPSTIRKSSSLALMNLQKELDECVAREDYERAAKLRDEILELKKNSGSRPKGVPAA